MSSLKSQIGHPQGACGAAGIAATLVAMHHGQIPPTINLEKPDPDCDLDYVPEVGRRAEIEHAICNCIAFGSKNSALVLRKLSREFHPGPIKLFHIQPGSSTPHSSI